MSTLRPTLRHALAFTATMIVTATAGAQVAPQPAAASLPRPIVRLDATRPEIEITIDAAGADGSKPRGWPYVADITPAAPSGTAETTSRATVRVIELVEEPLADAARRRWRARAIVPVFTGSAATLERQLKVSWPDGTCQRLTYWLTNAPPAAFTWKVSGLPNEWNARGSWCLPLRLTASGPRATGILMTSTLVEQSTKAPMAPRLYLATTQEDPVPATGGQLEAAVQRGAPVYLCANAATARPGKYQGAIAIGAAEKPDADSFTVTLYTTTWAAIFWGTALLAAGCGLAFVARVLVPARLQRAQALLPAALVKDRGAKLATRLGVLVPAGLPQPSQTSALLANFGAALATHVLEAQNMVPRRLPNPFVLALDTAGYRALLDTSAAQLAKLDVVVDGFARAMTLGAASSALPACLTGLDGLAPGLDGQTLDQVRTAVDGLLHPLLAPNPAAAAVQALTVPPRHDTETLLFEIQWTSGLTWLTSTTLTFVVGLFYLVLQNPAFGVPMDFLICVGWGFGLPTAASQLNGASARDALGVTLPKVTP